MNQEVGRWVELDGWICGHGLGLICWGSTLFKAKIPREKPIYRAGRQSGPTKWAEHFNRWRF